jgi:hypothetical protein
MITIQIDLFDYLLCTAIMAIEGHFYELSQLFDLLMN